VLPPIAKTPPMGLLAVGAVVPVLPNAPVATLGLLLANTFVEELAGIVGALVGAPRGLLFPLVLPALLGLLNIILPVGLFGFANALVELFADWLF
jgi:hypothetical protein